MNLEETEHQISALWSRLLMPYVSTTLSKCTSQKELLQNDFDPKLTQTQFFNISFCDFFYHRSWLNVPADQEGQQALKATEIIQNRSVSLTWPAHMQIYWNKRKCLHKKRVQLPEDWFGTPTWPPFHCFWTPIWLPRRHVKTLYTWC